jgi:acetate kinase
MKEKYLIINAGSSSLKFSLYEMPNKDLIASGTFEKIGSIDSFYTIKTKDLTIREDIPVLNHVSAVNILIGELLDKGIINDISEIKGVGHRVLHGGEYYKDSVLINEEVISNIQELTKFGPLHHPGQLSSIKAMKYAMPKVPQVAVFDTAFHQTMPKENYIYPVPYEWYLKYGVRKYGFHGTSHKYITETMKKMLGKEDVNLIICHVGSGASISCIKDGKCFDTTMGLTPLDGLMMGTRCGAIDPSIIEYVCKESGKDVSEITNDLNKKSGLLGICGYNDNRDVEKAIEAGDERAKLALDMYVDIIDRYIAEYYIELDGKVDAIVMTAGVLENGAETRKAILDKLKPFGIEVDDETNSKIAGFKEIHEGLITTKNSKIPVYVIPTNEEIMIIRDTYNFIK